MPSKHPAKKQLIEDTYLEWRVNTPQLLKEILENYPGNKGGIFFQPINILRRILAQIGERAAELNDPVLNALMCRLALYGEADPYDKGNYNHDKLNSCLNSKKYLDWINKKATE